MEEQNIVVVEEKKGLSKKTKIGLAVVGSAILTAIVGAVVHKKVKNSRSEECYEAECSEEE